MVLWIQCKLRLRGNDWWPTFGEIFFHLAVWSILFEIIGPHILQVTGDPLDVVAYFAGGLGAGWWWKYSAQRGAQLE